MTQKCFSELDRLWIFSLASPFVLPEEIKSYGFGETSGWINIIFGWSISVTLKQRSVFGICTCSWSRAIRADLRSEKRRRTASKHLTFNEWMRAERSEAVPVIIHRTNRLTIQPCRKRRPLEICAGNVIRLSSLPGFSGGSCDHASMQGLIKNCIKMHWTPAVAEALHRITVRQSYEQRLK